MARAYRAAFIWGTDPVWWIAGRRRIEHAPVSSCGGGVDCVRLDLVDGCASERPGVGRGCEGKTARGRDPSGGRGQGGRVIEGRRGPERGRGAGALGRGARGPLWGRGGVAGDGGRGSGLQAGRGRTGGLERAGVRVDAPGGVG